MAEVKNANLVFKDKNGNIGYVKSLTDADIAKIQLARDHVAKIVDQTTGDLIKATTTSLGVVQLASDADIAAGTVGAVVDAKQLADVKSDLSKVYKYKGSVATHDDLPTTGVQNGDVYNVEQAFGDFPAGTNYAAIVDDQGGITWDALGGSIDTSDFATKSGDNQFTGTNTVVDIAEGDADGKIANKKYVDDSVAAVSAELEDVVVYAASEPAAGDVRENSVEFYPASDLLV